MKRQTVALVVIAGVTLMLTLDATIVNVALPTIRRDLGFDAAGLEWVVAAYTVTFGGMLLAGGRSGDLFGRRRMFMIGVALFGGASLLCGLAPNGGWLVAARALQGVGAAIANPTALALIATTFPTPAERGRAMGVYATMAGAGSVLGLVLGGVLTDLASWRWVFLVNVPVAVAALALAPRVLPRAPGEGGSLDVPGVLTATGGMALLVDGLVHAAQRGWATTGTVLPLVAGVVLLAAFVAVEARSARPLLPLSLLAGRARAATFAVILAVGLGLFGTGFFLVLLVQDGLHLTALQTGLGFLPMAGGIAVTAMAMGRAAPTIGTRPGVVVGPLVAAAGAVCIALVAGSIPTFPALVAPMLLLGVGLGAAVVPLTLTAMATVPPAQAGIAAALVNSCQQVGGGVGLALLGTIAAGSAGTAGAFAVAAGVLGAAALLALAAVRVPALMGNRFPAGMASSPAPTIK